MTWDPSPAPDRSYNLDRLDRTMSGARALSLDSIRTNRVWAAPIEAGAWTSRGSSMTIPSGGGRAKSNSNESATVCYRGHEVM
jgi:hypothetical protein